MKVRVTESELWPVFKLDVYGFEIDLTAAELAQVEEAQAAWDKAQALLESKVKGTPRP